MKMLKKGADAGQDLAVVAGQTGRQVPQVSISESRPIGRGLIDPIRAEEVPPDRPIGSAAEWDVNGTRNLAELRGQRLLHSCSAGATAGHQRSIDIEEEHMHAKIISRSDQPGVCDKGCVVWRLPVLLGWYIIVTNRPKGSR